MVPVNLEGNMKELKINYHFLNQCDMQCKFCFGQMNRKYSQEEIVATFKSLVKLTNSINLAGGEIFLNIELLKHLVEIGVKSNVQLSLITNGYILTNNLDDPQVRYIISNVKQIGVSIDSFKKLTNIEMGRHVSEKIVSLEELKELREVCNEFRTKLKINSVITQANLNETLGKKMSVVKPDVWKVIQVVSEDEKVKIQDEQFEAFLKKNKLDNNINSEFATKMRSSYIMVNNEGVLFYDGKHIDDINVNEIVEVYSKNPTSAFYNILDAYDISIENYFERYSTDKKQIAFNKFKYLKTFNKEINTIKGNILFLDVESITPRPRDGMRKYLKYSHTQLHLLYTGLVVSNNLEVLEQISDYIPLGVDIVNHLNSDSELFKDFFRTFFKTLKRHKITDIVVSGIDTERNFIQDCIYYIGSELNRKDYEFLQKLLNNLHDIQSVKRNGVFSTESNKTASRSVLDELHAKRPDLFYYTRDYNKDGKSSLTIAKLLIDLYIEYTDMDIQFLENSIQTIRDYCLDDVYDDFELAYIYEGLLQTTIQKEIKGDI
jgi:radical S-adenosyl methionine domain-containing protein 2